jgi:hypothetical protein
MIERSVADRARRLWTRVSQPALFGTLRRTRPLSDLWGYDRGLPVDRHYIDRFLRANRDAIRGRALEVGDARYATQLGSAHAVEVLDVQRTPKARWVADLCAADELPSERFDVFVCTQVLQYVSDLHAALSHSRRVLSDGGVMLATLPVVARVDPGARANDLRRFTPAGAREAFSSVFGAANVTVTPLGNVLSCAAFLMGVSAQELRATERDHDDPDHPLILGVRARRTDNDPA